MVNKLLNSINVSLLINWTLYFFPVLPLVSLIAIAPSYANPTPIEQTSTITDTSILSEVTPASSPASPDASQIQVEKIEVTGSTIFGELEFNPIIEPLQGRTVSLEELLKAADQITELYLNQGYLTSRAVLDQNSLSTGVIKIQILEGSVENIEVQGAQRLENYVRARVGIGTSTPLNTANLEDQLRLLKADPLFDNIEASLKPGTGVGQSILVVRVSEANPFAGNFSIDNYSPPSVGATRLSLNLINRNLTGIGDAITGSYRPRIESIGGTYRLEFSYQAPLNPMNGTIEARVLIDNNEVVEGDFEPLDISGESQRYSITYRQPLIRTPREELALSLGFDFYHGQTFTFAGPTPFGFGPDEDGISTTSVFTFAQDYTLRDPSGAWAFRSQFRLGTGLFDTTSNPSPIPDSQFFSWLGQVQRVQVLGENNFLILQLDLQLTPDPLLPSEQFAIGGGQSVRGYRQNILAGDNGFRFSIEDRITIARDDSENPVFTIAPFFDMGAVWNAGDNPNSIVEDQRFIAGLGLGLIWQPFKGLNLRLDYAPPLINLDTSGDNIQDHGLYFSAGYSF